MSPEMLLGSGHGFGVDYYSLGAILFEMLTGLPPHYSTDQGEMYSDIVEKELVYPAYLNKSVINLLKKLLHKNPDHRICFEILNQVKQHHWCADIDWTKIERKEIDPPIKPDLLKSNFDPEYTELPLDFSEFE